MKTDLLAIGFNLLYFLNVLIVELFLMLVLALRNRFLDKILLLYFSDNTFFSKLFHQKCKMLKTYCKQLLKYEKKNTKTILEK